MSSVIYKNIGRQPIWADSGTGIWLEDRDGVRYLDTCGGVAVSSLGHRHHRIAAAVEREARSLAWAHAGTFTTEPAEELADLLASWSGGLPHVQFLSGGSEVMELAVKIVYQYHCARSEPSRQLIISRRQSYHGSTLGMLAISGNRQRRSVFEPLLGPAEFVSPCYSYRGLLPGETPEAYGLRLAEELEETILRIGPERVAAFVAETVVGSTAGAVPPVPGYFRHVKRVCAAYGVLLLLDEVMAGLGRTGRHFAYLDDGVVPDLVTVGKGLGAGYMPLAAVLVSADIHTALAGGQGVLQNGQTHVNHPLACAIGLEVQRTIVDEGLLDNVRARGEQLRRCLAERLGPRPYVGDVRGRGLFTGVELVADRATKEPLRDGAVLAAALKREGLERGLLLYPGSGTIDGVAGNHVLFAPPFIITEPQINLLVDLFAETLDAVVPVVSR
jgi:adenosylmethionine-8-amino-7-oxononanoate aminotransferase